MAGRSRLRIYFDGGCRPNPGPIEVAVVLRGVAHIRDDLGPGSNTDAEWLALIHAVELAGRVDADEVELLGDALAVVRQARAALSSGLAANAWAARFLDCVGAGSVRPKIRWIKRQQNLAGIALAARHPR